MTEQNAVVRKTRELCQTILDQPEYQSIRTRIDSFLADDEAKAQYQRLSEKGEVLQQKQQQGSPLSDAEIADFESHRQAFFSNPVAKDFVDAQQEMHEVQESVTRYVAKTFEIGRVPAAGDFESCGHDGCGCQH